MKVAFGMNNITGKEKYCTLLVYKLGCKEGNRMIVNRIGETDRNE
jgi:hypothetical protein